MEPNEQLKLDGVVDVTAPSVTFEYGGVQVRISGEHLSAVLERALQDRHTVAWGHRCGDLFNDADRAKAVDWLIDELAAMASAAVAHAVDGDGVELVVG